MSFLHKADQFNSIHDRLIAKWKDVASYLKEPVYFASLQPNPPDPETALDLAEDYLTTIYLQDTANQAGLATRSIALQDIGWNQDRQAFVDVDPEENQILSLFKLYPWESMLGRGVRAGCACHLSADDLDRAYLEDAALEQGHPAHPMGALPKPTSYCWRLTSRLLQTLGPRSTQGPEPMTLEPSVLLAV